MTRGQRQPAALCSPGGRDESDGTGCCTDGDQGAAGGAQLCSQLPGTVLGMFFCLRRVPQVGTAPGDTELCADPSRIPVVRLGADIRGKLVWKEVVMVFLTCSRQDDP